MRDVRTGTVFYSHLQPQHRIWHPADANTYLLNKGMTSSAHFKVLQPLENSTVWAAAHGLCANRRFITPKAGSRSAELNSVLRLSLRAGPPLQRKPHPTLSTGASPRERGEAPCSPTILSAILKANSEAMVVFFSP